MAPLKTTQAEVTGSLIDLAIGHPSPRLLPVALLRAASDHALAQADPSVLQYGYEQGDERFRTALSRFLGEHCGTDVGPEELFVSGGVSQALDLICSVFTRPGDVVLVEEPTYFLALRIFADHGLRAESLPTDEHGLLPAALERSLARRARLGRKRPAFLYTVPTHQNPTGATLSEERRLQVLELAGEHGLLVVSDEVYHLLTYEGAPPPTFAGRRCRAGRAGRRCRPGRAGRRCRAGNSGRGSPPGPSGVLSLGSFSKILAPGLRLGWVTGEPRLLEPLASCGFLDSGGGLAPLTSAIVRSAMERGDLYAHIQTLRRTYAERAAVMTDCLRRRFGPRASFVPPRGGFFHWLDLGPAADAQELLPLARERGVSFVPGVRFSSVAGLRSCLRLSFSYYDPPRIQEGIDRLATAFGG